MVSNMAEKLSNYCTVISGYAFKSNDLQEGDEIPVIKIGNISNGANVIIDDSTQYVDSSLLTLDEKYHIKKGDILISLTGSHINQPNSMVGRCCRNKDDKVYLLNQRAGKIIPKSKVDKDFLYYVFSMNAIKYAIANRAYGGANQVNVSPTDIMNIKFELPDISIQRKIAKVLKVYDDLIDVNTKRIKILEKMAADIYVEWFVHFRFPGFEKEEFEEKQPRGWVTGNKEKYYAPKIFKYEEFKTIGEFVRGKNITAAEMEEGEIPVISAGLEPSGYHNTANVFGPNLTISASGANAGFLKYNLDDIWAADCSYYQGKDNIWFVYNTLKYLQPVISNLQCGAAQPHVYPKHINRLSVLVPTDDFIIRYNQHVEQYYKEILLLKRQNGKLAQQRDMLLPRLMSGKQEVK